MGRMYSVQFSAVAVTAVQDLFELTAADDKPIRIAGLFLMQDTDAGDAEEEILELRIRRGNTTSGNGTAAGEIGLDPNTATPGFVAETNGTTQASAGTAVELFRDGWNVRMPYALILPEDMRPGTNQGAGLLCVSLESAPADSITCSGTLLVEEL